MTEQPNIRIVCELHRSPYYIVECIWDEGVTWDGEAGRWAEGYHQSAATKRAMAKWRDVPEDSLLAEPWLAATGMTLAAALDQATPEEARELDELRAAFDFTAVEDPVRSRARVTIHDDHVATVEDFERGAAVRTIWNCRCPRCGNNVAIPDVRMQALLYHLAKLELTEVSLDLLRRADARLRGQNRTGL